MDQDTQKNIISISLVVFLAIMVWFISRKAMQNRKQILESSGPKIAGEDELAGGARNPQLFDEPDEEALEEMAKLLEDEDEEDYSTVNTENENSTFKPNSNQ
jgi:hypothetical protein